jgi:hypothetical protein
MNHRYVLEPYRGPATRYTCPKCFNRHKTFVRYIDTETGQHISPDTGRCNRESNCGYHYTPKQFFTDNKAFNSSFNSYNTPLNTTMKKTILPAAAALSESKPASLMPHHIFTESFRNYNANNFISFLFALFGTDIAAKLIEKYWLGTSGHWPGATVFWQISGELDIRAGKIMLYNASTGKRVREPFNHITWLHTVLNLPDFNLQQCFFGEHLLRNSDEVVAIAESEKTAVIASAYFPDFIWLACGSLNNLTEQRCRALSKHRVILFPDINGYKKWSERAARLQHITEFTVSDLLEQHATTEQRRLGLDLADILMHWTVQEFQQTAFE